MAFSRFAADVRCEFEESLSMAVEQSQDLKAFVQRTFRGTPSFQRLEQFLAKGLETHGRVMARGLRGSSLGVAVAALAQSPALKVPVVFVVTANAEHAVEVADDARFAGASHVLHYAKSELLPYDTEAALLDEQVSHMSVLHALATGCEAGTIVVSSIEALFTRVPPASIIRDGVMRIEWGDSVEPMEFSERAIDLGYRRVPTVEARGEFSVRGGIIDIFPPSLEWPVRLDLFGDQIESMRPFEVSTQRSIRDVANLESLIVMPAQERVWQNAAVSEAGGKALPLLLELLPERALVVAHAPELFMLHDERLHSLVARQYAERNAELASANPRGAGEEGDEDDDEAKTRQPYLDAPPEQVYARLAEVETAARKFAQLQHSLQIEPAQGASVAFDVQSFETAKPSLESYITQIRSRMRDDYSIMVVCDNAGQAQRLGEVLGESEVGSYQVMPDAPKLKARTRKDGEAAAPEGPRVLEQIPAEHRGRGAILTTGDLHNGFIFPEAGLYIVTDREIFGRYKRKHAVRRVYRGAPIADPREIRANDLVVHLDHGIGRFEGIRTQAVDGRVSDYLEIFYADGDKLLVPVEKIAYVHKYSGGSDSETGLDKLGGKQWVKRRAKSNEAIERMANELLELYAQRSVAQGYTYGPDGSKMNEFEASFLYTETPDQLKAIADVKRDMESDKPMDRLVCGDVGYGKTEVAIRAMFKAMEEGKQVALLCPTTILAQQHFTNIRERLADYSDFKVEMVSRFKTAGEVKKILAELKAGNVHGVVGTHALLSKSVQFRELGLVIVDEEQRFGVAQKERLKELRASVDFLTLTATPIPRTLYMALSGLRDMSVISTPPADRHPIKTRIIHWTREEIEEAILRELNRGGQVFFVHNRVHNIHAIAERIREVVPTARIAIGHGQMPDDELENVMLDFIDGKFDILVSTTIIESGVDIPNVNTIIINRADAFGLAQLYQLRGRVGRETRQAYAYLVVPAGQGITEQAVARLAAIQEFTELGSGFNLAMRDMEIRGTGNLLGKDQHGSVNAVGFELYCRMLEDTVEKMRGRIMEDEIGEVEIMWKSQAHIPARFVPVESQRVMLYKRIADAREIAELDDLANEMRDRYGDERGINPQSGHAGVLPAPVRSLLAISRIRLAGRKLGLDKVVGLTRGFRFVRPGAVKELGPLVAKVLSKVGGEVYTDNPGALEFHYENLGTDALIEKASAVIQAIADKAEGK